MSYMKTETAFQEFFDGHAPNYLQNCLTKNTIAEVDFLIEVLGLSASGSVLDVGCGTGRHAIELARRGYRVTGVDISPSLVAYANELSRENQLENVAFVVGDMRERATMEQAAQVVRAVVVPSLQSRCPSAR